MNTVLSAGDVGWAKLHLLAHGIEVTPSVGLLPRESGFAVRRNFYNSPNWQPRTFAVPQELRVATLVVGLNTYGHSPWRLVWRPTEGRLVLENDSAGVELDAELIPDLELFAADTSAARVMNLYGGAALAFFSPRSCYFFNDDSQCGFCSLAGTAEEERQYAAIINPDDASRAVAAALETDSRKVEQVMIVGGNMRDLDRGFRHHLALAEAIQRALVAGGAESVSIHIATMPPRDLGLLDRLASFENVHVMFNLEVWDAGRFAEICPGKAADYGRNGMLRALERLRDVIGAYHAHSLLVTGLELAETTLLGATALAEMGISPILNIYHSDRHSRIGLGRRPPFDALVRVAKGLQVLHDRLPIEPYWRTCGRNAIDAEAQQGLFRGSVPLALTAST